MVTRSSQLGRIPEEEHNFEIYYKLIEQGAGLEQYDSNEKLEELAEGIFRELMGFEKALAGSSR